MSRRALVTGASSGIGEATVRTLRDRGWDVVAVARRADRLAALADETGASPFAADLTSAADVAALGEWVAETGPLQGLIHCAGGARGLDRVEDGDPDQWLWMYQANTISAQRLIRALLPLLRASAREGHADIVLITSTAAQAAYPGGGGYNAAKAAESMVAHALRQELNGEPIRVIEIAPGLVHTEEFSLRRFGGDKAAAEHVYADVERPLIAEDVADVIRYAVELPGHVNLDLVTMRPVAQATNQLIARGPLRTRE